MDVQSLHLAILAVSAITVLLAVVTAAVLGVITKNVLSKYEWYLRFQEDQQKKWLDLYLWLEKERRLEEAERRRDTKELAKSRAPSVTDGGEASFGLTNRDREDFLRVDSLLSGLMRKGEASREELFRVKRITDRLRDALVERSMLSFDVGEEGLEEGDLEAPPGSE
jgi:hypothetical protein